MSDTQTQTQTVELPPVQNLDVPAAFAPADQREAIAGILAQMKADGWSRPMISAITGFNDSTVWRAQRAKTHTIEVKRWNAFLQGVKDGTYRPTEKARKGNVKDQLARAQRAAATLARVNELRPSKAIREVVDAALALLPAPVADEPEADEAEVPEQATSQE
jgi:hypothetical protein